MIKVTYEDGHIVFRDMNGILIDSCHHIDIKDGQNGYINLFVDGDKVYKQSIFDTQNEKMQQM